MIRRRRPFFQLPRRPAGLVVLLLPAALLLGACSPAEVARPEPTRVAPTPVPTTAPAPAPPAVATTGAGAGTEADPEAAPFAQEPGGGAVQAPGQGQGQAPAPAPAGGQVQPAVAMDVSGVVARVQPAVLTVVNERQANPFAEAAQEAGRGTGFIISADGYVVTNEHVVRNGDVFEAILASGERLPARLIGADPQSDLAVVQIEGEVPEVVAFGDSGALLPGNPVLAIGSPLGQFTGTVTDGIVSALNRDFPIQSFASGESAAYTNLIQHNAAINPGNSGGPLFDLSGRVIGVNTLGIPTTPDGVPAQGLFFAIPSNTVQEIVGQLIEQGEVRYPFLGIEYREVVPQLAAEAGLPVDYGAYLARVVPGGPAADAGLEAGDIVVAVGDQRIDAETPFTEVLFAFDPGETVPVTVQRGDDQLEVEVTLEERPDR